MIRQIVFGLIGAAIVSPLFSQTSPTVEQQFQNPGKQYRPMVRWWWPGNDVTDEELKREVGLLDSANFGGAEIQPFTIGLDEPLSDAARKRVNDYMSPSFFSHVGSVLEEASSKGMWMDYTFGSGWPFGGGVVTPELATTELASAHQTVLGPVRFHQKVVMPELGEALTKNKNLPAGWLEQFKARERLVAVVAVQGSSLQYFSNVGDALKVKVPGELEADSSVVLTEHVQPDGTLDWDVPPGTWQLFTFKEMPTGQEVVGGAGTGPQLVLNHMNRAAFDKYAESVGGSAQRYDGKYVGHGLRAIFCDSLEVRANLFWNDQLLAQFKKSHGYDLTPYLPILKVPGAEVPYNATSAHLPLYEMKDIGERVRRDYWQTVSDLMIENFYSPFNQWASANHLLSRVQAHGSPTDVLRVYGESDIPETEDLLDNGRYDFLKMSSSGADLYGRHIVSSESFVWQGRSYQTTPEKIKRFADELLTAGINEIIYHGFPYRYLDRPFPGWHPFAIGGAFSSDMNENNPFWPYLSQLNQYITRVQYLSQSGTTVAPVALYRSMLAYDPIEPPPAEPAIDTNLMAAGYNFDHVGTHTLFQSKVVDHELVSPGGAKFKVLMFSQQETISPEFAKQLQTFAHEGLPIIFMGGVPTVESEVMDGKLAANPSYKIASNLSGVGKVRIASNADDAVRAVKAITDGNLQFHSAAVPFIEKRVGDLDVFFLRNPSDAPAKVKLGFTAKGTPEIWDPWTGSIRPIAEVARANSKTDVQVAMEPYGSALIVFNPSSKAQGALNISEFAQPDNQIAIGKDGWKFHGTGIGPGSKPQTVDLSFASLEDWTMDDRLKNFSGRGQYTTTFDVPASLLEGHRRLVLDLGAVGNAAEVTINGKAGPNLLLVPYKADVTALLHEGENTLQVTVTNAIYNAISANGRSADYYPEQTDYSNGLLPSGLVGPVQLEAMKP
jgi:hypothetical protein